MREVGERRLTINRALPMAIDEAAETIASQWAEGA